MDPIKWWFQRNPVRLPQDSLDSIKAVEEKHRLMELERKKPKTRKKKK